MGSLFSVMSTAKASVDTSVGILLQFFGGGPGGDKYRQASLPTYVPENAVIPFIRKIGEGPFALGEHANVWMGEVSYSPGNVVLKCLRGKFENNHDLKDSLHRQMLAHIETCRNLRHPNVAHCYDLVVLDASLTLVLPYFSNGTIIDYLKRNPDIPNEVRYRMIKEIVAAVAYLHGQGVPHCNIHCDNILVDENGHVMLCDTGIDGVIRNIDTYGRCPSKYRYKAPELMIPGHANPVPFPMLAADVWSLGRAVQEILTLRPPFHTIKSGYKYVIKMDDRTLPDDRPTEISEPVWNVLKDCCAFLPQDRPTAGELVPLFEEVF